MGGKDKAPSTMESTAEMMQAMEKYLPGLMTAMNKLIGPNEMAKAAAAADTAQVTADSQVSLLDEQGRELNRIGKSIEADNQLRDAEAERAVIEGPGGELVDAALAEQREIDPEFFQSRELAAGGIADLFKGLSGSEQREIEQHLARSNAGRGLSNSASSLSTVSNAMQFGQAGRNRLQQAIGAATQFLPASRLGFDALQVATGRSSGSMGDRRLLDTATQGMGADVFGTGSNMMNNIGSNQRTAMQANASRPTGLDQFAKLASGLGNIGSFSFTKEFEPRNP